MHLRPLLLAACLALVALPLAAQQPAPPAAPFDVIILHGHIIDGTGSPWYSGDIGIRAGRIAAIGNLEHAPAKTVLDAHGEVVAPGFIDMLGQSELTILVDPSLPSKIYQGITTEITGEGNSVAPINDAMIAANHDAYAEYHLTPTWRTLGQYFARLQKQGMGINLASYVGATSVRRMVLGDADVQPTPAQLQQMQALVRSAMREGAIGLSTALQYAPAPYATTHELIALASAASPYGGIYATHMRSEGDQVLQSIDETARIGREAHIPVEIWHLKAGGKNNFGKMSQIVAKIDNYRAQGVDISANTYAYTAWANTFSAFIPPWAHAGGDQKLLARLADPAARARIRRDLLSTGPDSAGETWDNEWQEVPGPHDILITDVQNPDLRQFQGKRLSDVAAAWKEDPIDALCDFLLKDKAFTEVAVFAMSEPDVELALKQPWVSIDNDYEGLSLTGILGQGHPHPRAYGTFPRILRKYVRQQHLLTLPDAIRKFSALPAQRMRLTDRGVLKQGMWADIVVFNPSTITDKATYADPAELSAGMDDVLVNGVPVIRQGKMTGALPGQVLRGPGYAP